MEKNILEILLTSTVITTLITVIVKLVQGFQKDKINNIPIICLPSSSPANAKYSLEALTTIWKKEINQYLKKDEK